MLFDCRLGVLLADIRHIHHASGLQVIVEYLVAKLLRHIELVGIPQFCEDLLDVVLVHAEARQVGLGAQLADERSVRDVGVGRLPLKAVDAVRVELVISHDMHHHVSEGLRLLLIQHF